MESTNEATSTEQTPVGHWHPLAYANLHDFETAKRIAEGCTNDVQALGSIIKQFSLSDILCVSLLHKHFNLYADERLIRTTRNNEQIVAPSSTDSADLKPAVWAFRKDSAFTPYKLCPIEFLCPDSSRLFNVEYARLDGAHEFRKEYLNLLTCRGLENLFGLSLNIRRLFVIAPDETLVENDTPHRRRLTLTVAKEKDVPHGATRTNWSF
ncbi:hypothetical protein [Achromobacter insolitus]|uniref:hypothetical protein n=1 Tax=Achromobacter insolitus TaxID=217204 RepID=UPI00174B6865|nr:hypothetical protein [Achromobacter insolitus]